MLGLSEVFIKLDFVGYFLQQCTYFCVLTVERMMERTFSYVLDRKNFKLLAAGRTDAKVSVNETYVQLFLKDEPLPESGFLELLNANLPQDIRVLAIDKVDASYNIINAPKKKEYLYIFSFGAKNHPFTAPFMVNIASHLDIALMQEGARLFIGTHDFRTYTYKPNPETQTIGHIEECEIVINDLYTANFFPKTSYIFRASGKGFKRHQIRLMMGALFDLGMGKIDLQFIKDTLVPGNTIKLTHIAQASGLMLHKVSLD